MLLELSIWFYFCIRTIELSPFISKKFDGLHLFDATFNTLQFYGNSHLFLVMEAREQLTKCTNFNQDRH